MSDRLGKHILGNLCRTKREPVRSLHKPKHIQRVVNFYLSTRAQSHLLFSTFTNQSFAAMVIEGGGDMCHWPWSRLQLGTLHSQYMQIPILPVHLFVLAGGVWASSSHINALWAPRSINGTCAVGWKTKITCFLTCKYKLSIKLVTGNMIINSRIFTAPLSVGDHVARTRCLTVLCEV